MKRIIIALLIVIWWVPSVSFADERVGSAALGAVSGAFVLGPIGAIAGAAVGYVAGPSIARSWGLNSKPSHSPGILKSGKTTSHRPAAEHSRKEAVPSLLKPRTASESKRLGDWESYCTSDCGSAIQF